MLVNALTYSFRIMAFYWAKFIGLCFDRKCTQNKRISHAKSQVEYEDKYMPTEFSLDWRYAQVK